MSRPLALDAAVAWHIATKKLQRERRFPFVTMLEPLEACNLSCAGCGRVREYRDVIDRRLTVDECLSAVRSAGAPIVSVSGGEPLLHRDIGEIVRALRDDGRFMYLCTNGLLLEEKLDQFAPSRQLCFVVHLDGTEAGSRPGDRTAGDAREGRRGRSVRRFGAGTASARTRRSSTDQTPPTCTRCSRSCRRSGVEGLMVSPGFAYGDVQNRDLFLERGESIAAFRRVLDPSKGLPFYNNPLYLDFLRGDREYPCAAWTTVTYTVLGWRLPCYAIADRHAVSVDELYDDEVWSAYGPGIDPRCGNCMMHSSFEGAVDPRRAFAGR